MVVLVDLFGHRFQSIVTRHGDDADGAVVLVRVIAGDAVVGFERIARTDALVVRHDEHVRRPVAIVAVIAARLIALVQDDRARRVGHRNHAA